MSKDSSGPRTRIDAESDFNKVLNDEMTRMESKQQPLGDKQSDNSINTKVHQSLNNLRTMYTISEELRDSVCLNQKFNEDTLPDCLITDASIAFDTDFVESSGLQFFQTISPDMQSNSEVIKLCSPQEFQRVLKWIDKFGTHFVSGLDMGCEARHSYTMRGSSLQGHASKALLKAYKII